MLSTDEIVNKSNTSSIQAVGIFCATDNCSRKDDGTADNDNKTTLTWTDGTRLVSDNDTTDVTLMDDQIYTTNVTGSIVK